MHKKTDELVWRALADPVRRHILDVLARSPRTTGEVVEQVDGLCRTAIMKHLDVLVAAKLVVVRREGRTRWNYLNPVPMEQVCQRWINQHTQRSASAMLRLEELVESPLPDAQSKTSSTRKKKAT